jgi:anti-sigma regulatory factor (Ser/Thr protein kinase)
MGWSVGNYTIEDVVAIASEIVANAVNASTRDQAVTLALFVDARNILVMCFDEADGMPVVQSPTVDQTSGRGLVLVEALRENFWTFDLDDMGKVVFVGG